jgi:hypothetical protein
MVTGFIQNQKISGMPSDNEEIKLPFKSAKFAEVWSEWQQYRRERKLPAYKPIGLKKVFAKLVRESESYEQTAIDMIEQAMGNYWIGIYPLQQNYYGATKNNQPGGGKDQRGTSADRIKRAKDW